MAVGNSVSHHKRSLRGHILRGVITTVALLSGGSAFAVSDRVKSACRDDYFQHCSQYAVGSEELRQCMRKVGENLSTPCLVALVQDGEITKQDVERHNAAKTAATKAKPEKSPETQRVARNDPTGDDPPDPKDVNTKSEKNKKTGKKATKQKEAAAADDGAASAKTEKGTAGKTSKGTKVHAKKGAKSKTTTTAAKKAHKSANATAGQESSSTAAGEGTPGKKAKKGAKAGAKSKSAASAKKTKKAAATTSKPKSTSKTKIAAKKQPKSTGGQTP